MNHIDDLLSIDPPQASQHIERFLQDRLEDMGRKGIVMGLSGGLDSAVAAYLSVRSVGPQGVTLLHMPERDSKPLHRQHARRIARELGATLLQRDITPILRSTGSYGLLPMGRVPGRGVRDRLVRLGRGLVERKNGSDLLALRMGSRPGSLVARGNAYASAKHRVRMVLLYTQAEREQRMVVGAVNRTEWLTGTFSQWGIDNCADVMPLLHLYRSQLPPLAEYLGIPAEIRSKPADPDVMPGVDNKEEILGSFLVTDQILAGLEKGVDYETLARRYGPQDVARVVALYTQSRHMRECPYAINAR